MGYHFPISTGVFFAERTVVPRHQHTQKKQRKRNGKRRNGKRSREDEAEEGREQLMI